MSLMILSRRFSRLTLSPNLFRSFVTDVNEEIVTTGEEKKKRKFIKVMHNRPIVKKQRELNQKLDEKASNMNLSWRFVGAT